MSCATRFTRARSSSILQSHLDHFSSYPSQPLTGLRIGLPLQTHLPAPNLQIPPLLLEHLESLGATLHSVDIPSIRMALPAYYVIASAEASSNLARYGGGWFGSPRERGENRDGETGEERRRRIRTEGFGREVKKRLLAGTYALSAESVLDSFAAARIEDMAQRVRQHLPQGSTPPPSLASPDLVSLPHPQPPQIRLVASSRWHRYPPPPNGDTHSSTLQRGGNSSRGERVPSGPLDRPSLACGVTGDVRSRWSRSGWLASRCEPDESVGHGSSAVLGGKGDRELGWKHIGIMHGATVIIVAIAARSALPSCA